MIQLLVATQRDVLGVDTRAGVMRPSEGLDGILPSCLAADPMNPGRAWCGTAGHGILRTDDRGATWRPAGLSEERVMAVTASPVEEDVIWAGTEPSAVWRSSNGGATWQPTRDLTDLPSSPSWAFPPRPETHHVRWIACHPRQPGRLHVAIEAGALIATDDAGRSWRDRVAAGPVDTHELAIHPDTPERLRVSAGDGYFESSDGGITWERPGHGLEVGYLRSVAIDPGDPEVVIVSAASRPRTTYAAGRSDGRLYRRVGRGRWERVRDGWPEPPTTIAPLIRPGTAPAEFWAADERGVHRSVDAGESWRLVAPFPAPPDFLRGFALLG